MKQTLNQPLKCTCLNNYPVKLPDDDLGGERYTCGNCGFNWRYVEIIDTHCLICVFPLKNSTCELCKVMYKPLIKLVYW